LPYKENKNASAVYIQLLFVTLAFVLMVSSSYFFGSSIVRRHLRIETEGTLSHVEIQIDSNLKELETMLGAVSENVRVMLLKGADLGEAEAYIRDISVYGREETKAVGLMNFYAVFDIFDGAAYNPAYYDPDFDPADRPWFAAAVEANGGIAVTDTYVDAATGEVLFTYARSLFDDKGVRIATVCMDVALNRIFALSEDIRNESVNYWGLLDRNLIVMAHPNPEFLGMPLHSVDSGISGLADELERGEAITERKLINYKGEESVVTTRALENGWRLLVATPIKRYYSDLRYMQMGLIGLGIILAFAFSAILIRIFMAKNRAEELTQVILDTAPIGVVIWNKDLKIINTNNELMKFFDLQDKQEFANRFLELSPKHQANGKRSTDMVAECLKKAFDEGYYREEYNHMTANGELLPCEITFARIRHRDDVFVVTYTRDLREEKRMLSEMRKADRYREILLESMSTLIVITDMETDEIIYMNEKMKEMFHLGDDITGEKCWRLLNKDTFSRCAICPKNDPDCYLGKPYTCERYNPVVEKDFRILSRVIEWTDGRRVFLEQCDDITELKAAITEKQKAIEEKDSIANLSNILNGLDLMIYATDPDTNQMLFINDNLKRHLNIGECIGRSCYEVLYNKDAPCEFCSCNPLKKDPDGVIEWEEHNALTNRIYRCVDRYIDWPGGKRAHLQHSTDITDLKNILLETERLRNAAEVANKAKSVFLANMSHEIRTPMNAILGIAEIQLQNKFLSAETEDALGKIYESGDLLLNIINDILDLSKIEAGKLELAPVVYDIPSLINDTVQLNRLRYDSKPIEFKLRIDENTPLNLMGDELRIKQVLNNILSNAFKYTDKGEVTLSVCVEPQNGKGASDEEVVIVFRVTDTGHGLTGDQIGMIFDEYTRFNTDNNRTAVGTGLGMSITKRLLGLMGGEITVESEVGKGSVFTVRVKQKRVDSAVCGSELAEKLKEFRFKSTAMAKKSQIMREYMPYGSVLVVDDVESNIYVTKGMLIPYGLRIETAASGYEAIEKIKSGRVYDIVFMDHMMPRMDGIETTKIIRDMGYTRHIIALTANALVGQAEMFLQNGFDAFISKPIDSRELNAILNEHVRNKKLPEIVDASRREQGGARKKDTVITGKKMLKISDLKKFFILDAENAIKVLSEIHKTLNDFDADIESYVVTVHGMKSALLSIGETELSGEALSLELAGRERNIAKMSDETLPFLNELQSLIMKFEQKEDDSAVEVSDEDMAHFRDKMLKICKACMQFDKQSAKAVLDDLKQKTWPRHINDVIDGIAVYLLHSAFKKAAVMAEDAANMDFH